MDANKDFPKVLPAQKQEKQPGLEKLMNPQPIYEDKDYKSSDKLKGKVAIITGGDSGIGRAVSVAYANEGADVALIYLNEHEDAEETKRLIERKGRRCITLCGDLGDESFCFSAVSKVIKNLNKIDILVNNAGEQYPQNSIEDITKDQLEKTFKTNIFSMFYMVKACLPHMKEGTAIVNTSSVTAYKGNGTLIDYSASKGAVTSFTRSLALSLAKRNIRVNAVAPGPVWTPLIPSSICEQDLGKFGSNTVLGRPGQPVEISPAYVFLASDSSTFITGETIHVNGGEIING